MRQIFKQRNIVTQLGWTFVGRVMVTHVDVLMNGVRKMGLQIFQQLDNDCRIQPGLLDYSICRRMNKFCRVLRVPSGRLLLLGPLAGAVNDSVDDLPPADPRLCPFEPPTPQWSLGRRTKENFLKTQILDMEDV